MPKSALVASVLQDLRFSLRTLTRNPGFTSVAVLTIALGVGVNAAMFSVVQGVLLAPLPFPGADRLTFLWQNRPGVPHLEASYPNFEDWERRSRSFDSMAAFTFHNFNLGAPGRAEHLMGMRATSALLETLGVKPVIGRGFNASDDLLNAAPVVLISDGLWRERFRADPYVAGKFVELDGKSFNVVGVLPSGFRFLDDADLLTPMRSNMPVIYAERSVEAVAVLARLKSGITMRQAEGEMNAIQGDMDRQFPDANRSVGIELTSLKQQIVGDVRGTILLLFGAVTQVLLIACANVASLMLAKSTARAHEFGIRAALGASRSRIVRQLLTESLVLSLFGGLLGIAVAGFSLRALLTALPITLPRSTEIGLHWPVLLFTMLTSMIAGVLFGLIPALQSAKPGVQDALRKSPRGATARGNANLSRLVIVQFALTLTLMTGAGLLLRSVRNLWRVNPGFDTHNVISFQVGLSPSLTQTPAATRSAYQQLLTRIRQIPGVQAADLTNIVPLSGGDNSGPFWTSSLQPASLQEAPHALYFWTGPDYLKTMGIPLLQGRFFTSADRIDSEKVVVIDNVLAQTSFPGRNPVGQTLTVGHWGAARIVGVVGHVRHWGLDDAGTHIPRQIYIPVYQLPDSMVTDFFRNLTLLLHTALPPAQVMPAIRNIVYASSPEQPVYDVRSMNDVLSASLTSRSLPVVLLGAFAALALVLASIGIYGVVSYSVTRRTQEIGVRMALGSNKGQIFRLIMQQAAGMAGTGLGIGILVSLALVHMMPSFSRLLYGIGGSDPLTLAGAAGVLLLAALVASYVPALRALRTNPMDCLRTE
jgi:predicted permease